MWRVRSSNVHDTPELFFTCGWLQSKVDDIKSWMGLEIFDQEIHIHKLWIAVLIIDIPKRPPYSKQC
jgi:hypothetical protein